MGQLVQERYAQSLIEFAIEQGTQDEIFKQITILSQIFKDNKEYQNILSSPIISKSQKHLLISNVFDGRIDQSLLNFLKILADNGRFYLFDEIANEYTKLIDEHNEVLLVTVTTVIELNDEIKAKIKAKIGQATKRKIRMETKLDINLIGGILIQYKNTQIDASLNNEFIKMLEQIKKATF